MLQFALLTLGMILSLITHDITPVVILGSASLMIVIISSLMSNNQGDHNNK